MALFNFFDAETSLGPSSWANMLIGTKSFWVTCTGAAAISVQASVDGIAVVDIATRQMDGRKQIQFSDNYPIWRLNITRLDSGTVSAYTDDAEYERQGGSSSGGSPAVITSVSLATWPGMTFNTEEVDNSVRLQAAFQDAADRNTFVKADFADIGYLNISAAVNPLTSIYGDADPEFYLSGPLTAFNPSATLTGTRNKKVVLEGFALRKRYFEHRLIQNMAMDAAGQLTATFYDPVPFVVGDGRVQVGWDMYITGGDDLGFNAGSGFNGRAVVSVSSDKLTCVWNTGNVGNAFSSYDPSRSFAPTSMVRRGGLLTVTAPSAHHMRPGMRVSVLSGHVDPGQRPYFNGTRAQTGRLVVGSTTLDQLASTTDLVKGMGVWCTDGVSLAVRNVINLINSSTSVTLTTPALFGGSGKNIIFSESPMDFRKKTILRTPASNTLVVADGGSDSNSFINQDFTTYAPIVGLHDADAYNAYVVGSRDASQLGSFALVVNACGFLSVRDVTTYGCGVGIFGATDSEFIRVITNDTVKDAQHVTSGSQRVLLRQCVVNKSRDDCFPIVDYLADARSIEDIRYEECTGTGWYASGSRGFVLAGGRNTVLAGCSMSYGLMGAYLLNDDGSFFTRPPVNTTIRGLTIKGCGVFNNLSAFEVSGAINVDGSDISISDSQSNAMRIFRGAHLRFSKVLLDWNIFGPLLNITCSTPQIVDDIAFDGITLKESHSTAIVADRRMRDNLILRNVEVEDLNWSETANQGLIDLGSNSSGPVRPLANVLVDGLRWRNQRYANTSFTEPLIAGFQHRLRFGPSEMILPWFMSDNTPSIDQVNNGLQVIGYLRTDDVGLALTAAAGGATGDYYFSVPAHLAGKRFYPADLIITCVTVGGTVTSVGDIEVWQGTAGARGGSDVQLIAGGSTWQAFNALDGVSSATVRLCQSTMVRGYVLTATPTILHFNIEGSDDSATRADAIVPGQAVRAPLNPRNGTTHNGTNVIDGMVASEVAVLAVGMPLTAAGFVLGTVISSVGTTSITVSNNASASATVAITFFRTVAAIVTAVDRALQTATLSGPVLFGSSQPNGVTAVDFYLEGLTPQSNNFIRAIQVAPPFPFTWDPAIPDVLTTAGTVLTVAPRVPNVLTVPGATMGDHVKVYPANTYAAGQRGLFAWGEVTAANQVTVWLWNLATGTGQDLGSGTWYLELTRPATPIYLSINTLLTGTIGAVRAWLLGRLV